MSGEIDMGYFDANTSLDGRVKVYIETPDLDYFKEFVHNNAHLMIEFSLVKS